VDASRTEVIEGYVVDLACIRKYPSSEMLDRARRHTTSCALMGHCVESGYGIVQDNGSVVPLDTHGTPLIIDAAQRSRVQTGLRVRVNRKLHESEMITEAVELVSQPRQ
jgi:hypothetical protein